MDAFSVVLNELLVDTYRSIIKVESEMLSNARLDLSINEMHMIEYIAGDRQHGKSIGDIADRLDLARPSVTIAINKLVSKGYVEKLRCADDARMVYVRVTRLGQKADAVHRYFHQQMIRNISGELSETDKEALLEGVTRINAFFQRQYNQMKKGEAY